MTSSRNPIPQDDVLNLGAIGNLTALGVGVDDLDSEDVTLVAFVIDMSSSMGGCADTVIKAYNTEIAALSAAKSAGSLLVSTTTFADQPALLHGYAKIDGVAPLSPATYAPNGSTALYDAVLGVFSRLEAYRKTLFDNGVRTRAIVVVLSDGDDNVSKGTAADVRQIADRLVREETTTLAYVGFGSGGHGASLRALAGAIGFPSVITASQSTSEIRKALGQVSASILRTTRVKVAGGASFFLRM
jgi:hypothetical protein